MSLKSMNALQAIVALATGGKNDDLAKPRHIEQAQYETKVMHLLPRPKH